MEHLYWDLGTVERGDGRCQPTKSGECPSNDKLGVPQLQVRRPLPIFRGHVKRSPYRVGLPTSDHWFVAIDLGGLSGRVDAGVAVQPPPRGFLPEARTESPISGVATREPLAPVNGSFGAARGMSLFPMPVRRRRVARCRYAMRS
nr:DUF1883 domain-containing protein [Mycobacterium rhizamassiliense]